MEVFAVAKGSFMLLQMASARSRKGIAVAGSFCCIWMPPMLEQYAWMDLAFFCSSTTFNSSKYSSNARA